VGLADSSLRSRKRKPITEPPEDGSRRRRRARAKPQAAAEPGVAGIRFPGWRWLALCALIAIFARYYYWTIHPAPGPIREYGPYTLLADAFYHRQTYLRLEPAPELLALQDPYDPEQNRPYRLHDASLYKGKYYLYFGPAPALVLFLPYAMITGDPLPDRVGTWVFATAAFLVACFLLKLLMSRYWPRSPQWLFYFLCACLGFSNSFPFLLRRPAVYETAIAAGQFFVLLALYALARAVFGRSHALLWSAAAGLSIGAAFASRPHLVLAAGALIWLWLLDDVTVRERLRRLAAALLPLAALGALVLIYNYVRFDSPFEFGNHYQLAAVNVRKLRFFQAGIPRILDGLWYSLLHAPRLHSTFPFIVLAPAPRDSLVRGIEVVAGLVWLAPPVLLTGAAPRVWKKLDAARRLEWAVCAGTLLLLGAAWILIDAAVGATMRYQADFATVLLLASALVIAGWAAAGNPARWRARAVVALGIWGIVINGCIGMTGYYDNFRAEAPEEYQSTAALFQPVSNLLGALGIPP